MPDPHDPATAKTPRIDVTTREENRTAWQAPFLESLREQGNATTAMEVAGKAKRQVWKARLDDPTFKHDWDVAREQGCERRADLLEDVVFARALEGSDSLAMFMLKGLRPGVYGDRVRLETAVTAKVGELARLYGMTEDDVRIEARKLLTGG